MRDVEDTELGGTAAEERTFEAGDPAGEIDESGRTLEELTEEAAAATQDDIVRLSAERDDFLALAQRTQADFENYRKRVAREAASAEVRGVSRLARELLPALDNLERALAAAGELDAQVLEGLRLVHRELVGALERVGIESFGAAGERFDPELHEAVAQQPADGVEPGAISEVYQAGYRIAGGAILRPARVVVAG
jgi:molecular chaperone GrpE